MESTDDNFMSLDSENSPRPNDMTARTSEFQQSSDFMDENNFVKNVYIHRNGDMFSSSRRFVYNKKQLRTWDAFLEDLTASLNPRTGPIRSIHTPQTGSRIQTFEDIQSNTNYVALASGEKLQMIGYLKLIQEQEAAKKRRNYNIPTQGASEASSVPSSVQKRMQVSGRIKYEMQKQGKKIYIFRNGDEYTRAISVLMRHFELKSMESVLKVVEEKVILPTILPIRKLITMDGEVITDPDQLEDSKSYIASGYEPFIPCSYGQSLPNIVCGPKKQDRIRYLNSVTTPAAGKQRNKNKSHSTDSITPKSSRQIVSNGKPYTHRTEEISPKLQKSNPEPKPTEKTKRTVKKKESIKVEKDDLGESEFVNGYEKDDEIEPGFFEYEEPKKSFLPAESPRENDIDKNEDLYNQSAHIIQTGYRSYKAKQKAAFN